MDTPSDIQALIAKWPTIGSFADDLGCGYEAARQMRRRNSIAPEHWQRVIDVSERRGIAGIDFAWLMAARPSFQSMETDNG